MKNLITYLKTLWGAWGNLQSKDISLDRRLTVGSPSGLDAKWKQNPFMRFAVVLTLIFSIGVGNAWGDTKTWNLAQASYASANASTVTWSSSYVTMVATRNGDGNTAVNNYLGGSNANTRFYSGNKITFTPQSGYTVSSVSITCNTNYSSGFGSTWTNASQSTSSDVVTITPTNGENAFYCVISAQVRVTSVVVTYSSAAPATPYTVTFTKTDGSTQAITEASVGAGVTPPTMQATCGDWTFQGWSKSESDDDESTTVLTTETLTAGKYYPSANTTLYPVYTKAGTIESEVADVITTSINGKSGTNTSYTSFSNKTLTSDAVYAGQSNNGNNNTIKSVVQLRNTSPAGIVTTASGGILKQVDVVWNSNTSNGRYITVFGKNTSYSGSTDLYDNSTKGTSLGTIVKNTSTQLVAEDDYEYIGILANGALYMTSLTLTWIVEEDVTFYYSYPTCCTELGSINGSVNWSNPTTAVVTWNKLADQVTSWALSWSPNTAGSSITSAIADAGGGTQKTATVSGLACGTEYTFTVTPTVKSGVCPPASNPTIVSTSTKYSITRSGSPAGTVTGGTFTTKISGSAVTEACNGSTIQIAATPATGYEFTSWTISKAGGGTVTPEASSASTTFTMPSDNVTVTAAFSCITPTFGTNLTTGTVNYLTGDAAATLTVGASANGATINYQWQTKVGDGAWTNSGTNASGNTSITPSTAGPGTTSYRCIATNAASGCSATATSNVVTVVVTNPSGYCISAFNSSNNGITGGFSNGGSGNHYTLSYTIPGKDGSSNWPQYWVGENEAWASSFSANATFADMPLMSNNSATLGLAEGATGTLHIWNDNIQASSNLFIKFEPSGYGLRWGGAGEWDQAANTKAFTVDPGDANVYWTDIVTLDGTNNTTWNYYVGLQTASGYIYSGVDNEASDSRGISRTRSVTAMKVSNGTAGSWKGTYLSSEPTGSRGKFRIWNNNIDDYNFYCHWVPFYRVTYDGSGASGSTAASADVCCEGNPAARTVVAAANGFTVPTGKTFGGWASSPENAAAGVVAYAAGANVVLTSSITLYAIWTDINYTVTVNQYPSVGAETTGQTTTAHYNGTINLTTTVPSDYRFVNWTTSDGFSITNPTSATTASFTMPNKNVTVTANFQQTHTVDWYVGGSAPANKIGDDGQTTVVDHGGKIEDFPAHDPDGSACEKTFVGWTNTSDYVHGTSPLFTDVAGSPQINADAQFYAVFAEGGATEDVIDYATTSDVTTGSVSYHNWSGVSLTSDAVYAGNSGEGNINYVQLRATSPSGIWTTTSGGTARKVAVTWNSTTDRTINIYGKNTAYESGDLYDNSKQGTLIGSITYGTSSEANLTGDYEYIGLRSSSNALMVDDITITWSSATGHTINCASCSNEVEVAYDADPAGGTVAVVKGSTPIAENGTVKTCTGSVALTVTVTPANAHFSVSGVTFTPSDGLTAGELSGTSSPASTTDGVWTYNVTIAQDADGTLTISPSFNEDAHKVITWVVHGGSASIADGHGTTWVYSGENLTAIPDAPDAPTGCVDKVFVGWSENDGGATEGDASDYTDLFTTLGGAPTGITTDKTFTAVFATPAAGMGGTVMWDEPWTGYDNGDQPASKSGYNSATISYAYGESGTKVYAGADQHYAGGTQPELMVVKSGGTFTASNIPTAGQTSLTLTYKTNYSANVTVTSGTSGVTVSDPDVSGTTCTRTITISQSPATNNFALTFTMTKSDKNARLDDIHLVVPGSSSMSGYVTTCEDTWTITYYKNTEDAVTNLPSPTGISKSTGSGTLSSKVPVRYGYTFDGWAISAGGSVAYAAGASISSVSADMDLYAKWSVTPVTEINLSKTSLDKYVGDPSVTLSVLSVLPDGANTSVTWSSSNSSIATVNSSTGEVNFVAEGTANIIATSSITSETTATCVVTVWAKPTATFLDNLHSLTEDKDGNALSGYNLTDVAGTPVVFPVLANQPAGSGTCEDEFYVFIGWTTSDNNTDPEDHLVTSHNLTNGDNITYYAVWADGVSGTTYTKLTNNTFKTSPTKYVIGAAHADSGTEHYFYSCEKTDKNNSWGYVTADLANNSPIEFTLSGTAAALVATSTEVSARYLKPMAEKDFQLSASSQTVELKSDGTIYNNNTGDTSWRLLYNKAGGLRWYSSNVSGSTNAYFYEVVAGGEVNYRTSCCADKVSAPIVTATKTSTTVTLTWAAVSGATGYELQWNGGAWTAATSGVVKSDLTPNTNYSWRVRATYVSPKCGADIASGSTTTNQVYHVTYVGGSGTGSCNATSSTTDGTAYEAGATVTLQSNGFTLVGHTFNEWTEDDDDITISSNQFTMPEHDVVITATWTPKVDKFYDRMHDGTDASHGGIADGDGKYYITREGCSYTVPSLTDNTSGATACHTKHYVLMGWTAESHLNSDGTLKTGHEGYVYTGGGTQTATGATYYAVWAEVEE